MYFQNSEWFKDTTKCTSNNSEWFKDTTKCTSNTIVNDLKIQQNVLLTQ